MAYTAVPTVATGDLWTAANHNTYIRDNFAAGVPDIFTASGDLVYGSVADVAARLAIGSAGQILNVSGGLPAWTNNPSPAAATQAEQETGTSTTVYVSPGRQQFHPSAAKVWVLFNGTGTPAMTVGNNVSSITDTATGKWVVNFTTSFSTANYCVIPGGVSSLDFISYDGSTRAAGSVEIYCRYVLTGTHEDNANISVACFGDQ